MRQQLAVLLLAAASACFASENKFDVKDDVFAFPQYEVSFLPSYILHDDAFNKLTAQDASAPVSSVSKPPTDDQQVAAADGVDYEYMIAHGRPYLCSIPHVQPTENGTQEQRSEAEKKHDLIEAADRGWQLLQDMEGKQCLYYSTGWWSYSFCYNSHVKQFHGLNLGNGARKWPPQEDPTTPSYVLGRHDVKSTKKSATEQGEKPKIGELQTQAETTYLVQRLDGGTPCDLTGKPRKIEVQYHCNPQSTDRIGWIKETATCAYLMVIYTPRLCNDVAFQPPKESRTHPIQCQEILTAEEAAQLEERSANHEMQDIDGALEQPIMVGGIEVGAMKLVGQDGQRIEKGRIVMTADEKAETVVMQKDGQVQGLSKPELKKLDLNPEEVEAFRKELQKIAGSKDWKIERLGDANGRIQLRGVVASEAGDEKVENGPKERGTEPEAEAEGSEEEYKDEV